MFPVKQEHPLLLFFMPLTKSKVKENQYGCVGVKVSWCLKAYVMCSINGQKCCLYVQFSFSSIALIVNQKKTKRKQVLQNVEMPLT